MRAKDLKQGIEEYRELIKKKYSLEITQGEAERQFAELLGLFRVIHRPIEELDDSIPDLYHKNGGEK